MRVTFDAQVFSFQEYGGISQYFYQLFKIFSTLKNVTPEFLIKYSNNIYAPGITTTQVKRFFPSYRFKGRNEIIKSLNRRYVKKRFRVGSKPELFHPTYYDPYFLELLGGVPFVLTIYDMAHEHYPHLFSKFDYTPSNKKKVALQASRIIAISEHTKKDLSAFLHIPESIIDVIPLATTLSAAITKRPDYSVPENFILYVGKRNTYKNFLFLIEAFNMLAATNRTLALVCAGGGKFTREEQRKIAKYHLTGRITHVQVDDTALSYLYTKAQAFVFPSLYEGFGIPVLEAFACGCPAVLSKKSSLPEVGGDAARYFDPENAESLVATLAEVLEDKNLSDSFRIKGFERIKSFSWEKTARLTVETYKKAIGS